VAKEMNKEKFRVTAIQEENFYLIRFPDHPTLFTQATHIREIEFMARDLINLMLDIPLEEIDIEIELIAPVALTL
jgi:predicted RNase H-like HicB family nuclease